MQKVLICSFKDTSRSIIELRYLKLETISKGTLVPEDLDFYVPLWLDPWRRRRRAPLGAPRSRGAATLRGADQRPAPLPSRGRHPLCSVATAPRCCGWGVPLHARGQPLCHDAPTSPGRPGNRFYDDFIWFQNFPKTKRVGQRRKLPPLVAVVSRGHHGASHNPGGVNQ